RAVPIKFGPSWWTWPAIVAASVAGALWLPESSTVKAREDRRVAAANEIKEQEKAVEEIRAAAKVVEKTADADPSKAAAADALAARRLAALEKLEEELRTGKINADKARAESARTLEQAAAELEKRSDESQRAAGATRDRLAELSPPSAPSAETSASGESKS